MKTPFLVASVLAALAAGTLLAQESAPQPVPALPRALPARALPARAVAAPMQAATPQAPQPLAPPVAAQELVYVDPATGLPVPTKVKRFDLDFPGGGPADFIRVVSEARGKPVNAIIPDDLADTRLPEMHLKQVTLPQLFEALEAASHKTIVVAPRGAHPVGAVNLSDSNFGFRTNGAVNDDSIWTFYYERPTEPPAPAPQRVVRFYQLGPYLDAYKFDDITTAIQTGWKMLGETSPPTMNFHKETKLLIAVGEPAQLQIIDEVLRQLARAPEPAKPSVIVPQMPPQPH